MCCAVHHCAVQRNNVRLALPTALLCFTVENGHSEANDEARIREIDWSNRRRERERKRGREERER